jgi:hypothetical protein
MEAINKNESAKALMEILLDEMREAGINPKAYMTLLDFAYVHGQRLASEETLKIMRG